MTKKANPKTIEDVTEHCDKECILKAMALRAWDDKVLEQIKCIGLYKKECEAKENKWYTWTEITYKWKENYAEKFADTFEKYKKHLKAQAIYNVIMGREATENN